jgi:DNA-directed RNA polymerase subunit RPC12/RpoP
MKFCYGCGHVTSGTPLYCNTCGRTYNVKLCPRRHMNPRYAEACSQCGSRELSTPQPRVPWWVSTVEILLTLIPGSFLGFVSVFVVITIGMVLVEDPGMIVLLVIASIALGILWAIWSETPSWFRSAVYRLVRRRRNRERAGGE